MRALSYIRAASLDEALGAVTHHGPSAAVLAGGTDLLIEWRRESTAEPVVVVDISRLEELRGITVQGQIISLGPLTTHAEMMASPLLRELAPLLSSAASTIGSAQIRNRGTVGGNIMNAAACADTVPPLVALGAEVELRSTSGARTMKLEDLFVRPYVTKANQNEILTRIRFPRLPKNTISAFIKLGRRNAVSISRLSVAALLQCGNTGTIEDARIVPGAVLPAWKRIQKAEALLIGTPPSMELFEAAGRMVAEEMIASTGRRWSTEYKEPVIAVLVRRALENCVKGRKG